MAKSVRRPRIDLDARHLVATHGVHVPLRGILHDTESHDYKGTRDLAGIVNFWGEQGSGLGSHLIIDQEGNSAVCANPNLITYHTEKRNTGSIGIELIGYARFTLPGWLGRKDQLDKLARWMAWLNLEYAIPLVSGVERGWSTHGEQTKAFHLSSGHTDPGAFFPKGYVLRLAQKYRKEGWG